MTPEEISRFVAKGRLVCPYCGHSDPEGGPFDVQDDGVRQEMSCPECDRSWSFLYELMWLIEEGGEDEG